MVATIVYKQQSHPSHETSLLLPTVVSDDNYRDKVDRQERRQNFLNKLALAGGILILLCVLVAVAVSIPNGFTLRSVSSDTERSEHGGNHSGSIIYHEGLTDSESKCWWVSPNVETSETTLPGQIPDHHILRDKKSRRLRWGILGLGRIARDFTTALKMSGADITAVSAGSLPNATARAKAFAEHYSVPQSYGTYEELAADPNVDIVYIATINTLHLGPTLMMLEAGKNVLLEKPMAVTLEDAERMAQAAKDNNRLLLTNFWTRFFPVVKYIRSILASQKLGDIMAMRGDFGFVASQNPSDRFLNRTQGGGAMLDLGCYLINLAVMASPSSYLPVDIQASAQFTYMGVDYKVDTESSFVLKWDSKEGESALNENGTTMIMSGQASFRRPSSFEVEIEGTDGRLKIHGPANAPDRSTIYEYRFEGIGTLKHVELVDSALPIFDESYGVGEYPRGEGFVYVINELEQCMFEQGIPGVTQGNLARGKRRGCLELEELPMKEQLETVRITQEVMRKAGYWNWA